MLPALRRGGIPEQTHVMTNEAQNLPDGFRIYRTPLALRLLPTFAAYGSGVMSIIAFDDWRRGSTADAIWKTALVVVILGTLIRRVALGFAANKRGLRKVGDGGYAPLEPGKLYHGRVTGIREFGCFVECLPGKEGLVHISELADFRVRRTEDIVKMGDMIWVKFVGIDERFGKVRLSRKAAMKEMEGLKPAPAQA